MPVMDQARPAETVVVYAAVEFTPSVTVSEIASFASPVPLAEVLVALSMLMGLVTVVNANCGGTVALVAVVVAVAVVPEPSLAIAVKVIVPSKSALTSRPAIDQAPSEPTVVVWAEVMLLAESLATTEMVAPTCPVPLIDTAVSLVELIGLVTDEMTTVLFVEVMLLWAVLPDPSLAVAVKVIVPSFRLLRFSPLMVHVPLEATVVVVAVVALVPSLATSEIVAPASPVPLTVTAV